MEISEFQALLKPVTDLISSMTIDAKLAEELNHRFPPGGDVFDAIEKACHEAIWGRVIEPCEDTGGLSVDVVDLTDLVGSLHGHPTGEVCMVMPITPEAQFDDTSRGWCAFEAGSSHHPTVTNGRALILYLLPDGKIDFSDR
jgi:hypothetical protein